MVNLYFELKFKPNIENKFRHLKNYPWIRKNEIYLHEIEIMINKWLNSGICELGDPKKVKHTSPLLLVKKHKVNASDKQEYRLCIDFKLLNDLTLLEEYPIPNLTEELFRFQGAKSIIKLDIRHGFNNVLIHPNSRNYCGFWFKGILYQLKRMGFGFTNAPFAFQKFLQMALSGIPRVYNYLDDIYIVGKTHIETLEALDSVMQRLIEHGFKLRLDKCEFLIDRVYHLGRVVTGNGILISQSNVDKLLSIEAPTTYTQVKSILGQLNWLACFLPGISLL